MAFAQTRTFEQSFDLANFNVLRNLRFLRLKGSDFLASVGFMPKGLAANHLRSMALRGRASPSSLASVGFMPNGVELVKNGLDSKASCPG